MKIKLGISLILAFLMLIFISQNTDNVTVNFSSWNVEMSIALLVFIMLGTGVVLGWLLNSYQRFLRNRKQTNKQKHDEIQNNKNAEELVKKEEPVAATQGDKETT
jgi:uncharacterized integral membrane protein